MTANINDKVTRHVFSYYYGNDIKDARKIRLQSLLNDPNLKLSNSKLDFILDTGATNVLFPAQLAGITISEQYFIKNIDHKIENHSGIVSTSPIVYYRCLLDTFQLGDLVIKQLPVRITFDPRVTVSLLGMDFLKFFNIIIKPEFKQVILEETDTYTQYIKKYKTFASSDTFFTETYIDLSQQSLLDNEAIEAAYINEIIQRNS